MDNVIHDAKKVAYSSIVGQSIMLLNKDGACIGQLAVLNTDDPQGIADEVVESIKTPNRHGYRVGVTVGKTKERERCKPKVKPLEWDVNHASTEIGLYAHYKGFPHEDGDIVVQLNEKIVAHAHGTEEAKAAA